MTTLRPYQQACLDALVDALMAGRSNLAVMPTAGGKSVVLAALMAGLAATGKCALVDAAVPVEAVTYRAHHKPGRPSSLRVSYRLKGGRWLSE
jgi:superfamily II DNA or RNA helicase